MPNIPPTMPGNADVTPLAELAQKWRNKTFLPDANETHELVFATAAFEVALEQCAAELEASLAAASAPHREVAWQIVDDFSMPATINGENGKYINTFQTQALEDRIASALASARMDALAEAAAWIREYEWLGERYAREIVDVMAQDLDRMAASPPESAPDPREGR